MKNLTKDDLKFYQKNSLEIPIGIDRKRNSVSYFHLESASIHLVLSKEKQYLPFLTDLANLLIFLNPYFQVIVIDENEEVTNLDAAIIYISKNKVIDFFYNLDKMDTKTNIIMIHSIYHLFQNKNEEQIKVIESFLEKEKYFILFDSLDHIKHFTKKEWFLKNVNLENGIWLNEGYINEPFFSIKHHHINVYKDNIKDENYGILIQDGCADIIQIIHEKKEKNI